MPLLIDPVGYDVFSDGDDWDMAFRGTAGAKVSVYDTYTNTQSGCVDPSCLDVSVGYKLHIWFSLVHRHQRIAIASTDSLAVWGVTHICSSTETVYEVVMNHNVSFWCN